jgi:hypothetical protein
LFRRPVPALTHIWISPDSAYVVGISNVMLWNPYQLVAFCRSGDRLLERNMEAALQGGFDAGAGERGVRLSGEVTIVIPHASAEHLSPHASAEHLSPHASAEHLSPHASAEHLSPHASAGRLSLRAREREPDRCNFTEGNLARRRLANHQSRTCLTNQAGLLSCGP